MPVTEAPHIRLRRRAMDFLARREHTFAELLQKLRERHPDDDPELIRAVLEQLRDENLISDQRFLESFINHRMRSGMGPQKISFELRNKGVSDREASAGLSLIDHDDWLQLAIGHLQRKFPIAPQSMKEKQKAWRFLQQRGFGSDIASVALATAWRELH